MLRRRALVALACIAVQAHAAVASAHDYWMAPDRFAYAQHDTMRIDLWLGAAPVAEESRPWQAKRTWTFELVTAKHRVDLRAQGTEGKAPVIEGHRLEHSGPTLIAMERRWTDIELDREKFRDYLEHEGLARMLPLLDAAPKRAKERECYTRALKSLVQVGTGGDPVHDKVLGHLIEIVLLDDPAKLDPGGTLRARLLFRGKPLPDAVISGHVRTAEGKAIAHTRTTDSRGELALPSDAGSWILRTVHMTPCKGCSYAEWESYWTSFTFAID
jgi:uncharacterized GH25 family protein